MKDKQHQDKDIAGSPAQGSKDQTTADRPASDRDEAKPGTPGTGENIDPKTGEPFIEGIGGA
jgi:hypothetical protein